MAGSLGYCGLDRRRQPLAGDEIRECWEADPGGDDASLAAVVARPAADLAAAAGPATPLEFVEVHGRLASAVQSPITLASRSPEPAEPSTDARAVARPPLPPVCEPRWSLWGDLDR